MTAITTTTATATEEQISSPMIEHLEDLHRKYASLDDGAVATYIPELAKADPNWFGIALVTAGGCVYHVGSSRQEFTIQSISKPFVYGMALEDNGRADVLKKVGVEPTGDAFNAISLHPATGRPLNPMINAGAIASTSLIAGESQQTRLERLLQKFSLFAGRELSIDHAVYRSESESGHRNRAIGHMLRNFNVLTEEPDPVVDLYFKQCSISVNCVDLATMAATLAHRGVNPVTGKQAIRGEYVESVLSVMGSCGMYDFAGEWIYNVGMPAKSGVAGGIIAVLPGQLGIGVFSPRLDARGNSVRGIRVCEDLSRFLDLHLFNPPHASDAAIRLKFTAAEVNSSRLRTREQSEVLRDAGSGIKVYELQGKMVFATAEVVMNDVMQNLAAIDSVVFDMKRVVGINESACRLFHGLVTRLASLGKPALFTGERRFPVLRRYMKARLADRFSELFRAFDDNDLALEWCENRLLEQKLPASLRTDGVAVADYELLVGLSADEIATIAAMFKRRAYEKGAAIVKFGDEARELFFLARGTVSVCIQFASGAERRLATLSPGMTFGEMAVLDGARRSAMVRADSEVECDLLEIDDFNRLIDTHPRIKIAILKNLSLALCHRLRKADRELSVFED
jgi:glutaminase